MTDRARAQPGRLVFVTARYPPFIGGTEVHTAEVAKRLVAAGGDVVVLTTDTTAKIPRDTVVEGVRVRIIPAWPEGGDLYLTRHLESELRALDPAVIHVQGYHTLLGPMAMRAARRIGVPYVVTFHSGAHRSRLRNLLRPFHQRALTPLFLRASALIAVSDFEAQLFARRTRVARHQILTIPSGAKLRSVPATVQPTDQRSDATIITSLGRLERYKGHHQVIQALPHLLARRPDTQLRLLGTGSYEARLRRLVRSLGVEDSVEFLQVATSDRDELSRLLAESSLITLLSRYESQGLAAFEALSLGIPIMVLETTALAELTEAGLAAAVPPHTQPWVLASLIDRQLRHPEVASDKAPPGWGHTVQRLREVYEQRCGVLVGDDTEPGSHQLHVVPEDPAHGDPAREAD